MRRLAAAGAAVALAYVGAVLATAHFTNRTVRPLFDAVGPPPVYRWVKPPPDFAAGNIKPKSTEVVFGLAPDALPPAGASEDSQFVFNLPKGSIAPHEGDGQGVARVEPADPDSLGALPAKQFADGNAYKLTLRYETTATPAPVTLPGSVLLTVPVPAEGIVYSEDGKTWRAVKSQHASATAVGGELPGAGYYLAVTPDVISPSGNSGAGRLLLPIGFTVFVAAGLVITPLLLRRGRTPKTRQARRQAARGR
ncbi:MAG TPA: hypothetical protein VFB78_02275 [Acidimicrobiales bacterium]|nr:hypothetical protein [Acidimicrobiales bacterium]